MRLDALGAPNFIEANLMPGLSDHGYLSRCFFMNNRIPYDDMILSIINLALERTIGLSPEATSVISSSEPNIVETAQPASAGLTV